MVELLEGCGLYEETSDPVVMARVRAIELLGADAVTKRRGKPNMSADDKKIVARRKNLRALAVEIGAVNQSESYRIPSEELVPAIEAVTDDNGKQKYQNVAQMSDEEIISIIEGIKKGGKQAAASKPEKTPVVEDKPEPVSKPRRTRRPKAEPEPEVAPEPAAEEAPEEAAPKPAAKPRKPRAASTRRRRTAETETSPETAPAVADPKALELLTSMVKDIGLMVEKQGKQITDLSDTVSSDEGSLHDKVNAIEQFLCWFYNTEFAEGNDISSLDEVTWT